MILNEMLKMFLLQLVANVLWTLQAECFLFILGVEFILYLSDITIPQDTTWNFVRKMRWPLSHDSQPFHYIPS
jgi:hypothetical protein